MSGSSPTSPGSHNASMPNRLNGLHSPTYQRAMPIQPSPFNQYANPSPNIGASEVTIFSSQYTGSPAFSTASPIHSPYPDFRQPQSPPISTSNAELIDRLNDPPPPGDNADWEEYMAWKREKYRQRDLRAQAAENQQMRNQQLQQQQLQNSAYMSYSGTAGQMLPRHPGHMQQIYNSEGTYGFPYENLGHAHGLPGQRSQSMVQSSPGHCYGSINIKGDARVMRGNVVDSSRPNMRAGKHNYGGHLNIEGQALLWDGDQTVETAHTFWGYDNQQGRIK